MLQAQQAPALPYAKEVGRPGTGSYPAPSPDPTTHVSFLSPSGDSHVGDGCGVGTTTLAFPQTPWIIYGGCSVAGCLYSTRNILVPSRKNLVPSRNIIVYSRKNLVPSRNILVCSRNILVPSRKNLVPSRKNLVPSRNILVCSRNNLVWTRNNLVCSRKILVRTRNILVCTRKILVCSREKKIFLVFNLTLVGFRRKQTLLDKKYLSLDLNSICHFYQVSHPVCIYLRKCSPI